MILDGVIALISRYFTEFDFLLANYVTVVEDRPIMSDITFAIFNLSN